MKPTEEKLDALIKSVRNRLTSGAVCDSANKCEGWKKAEKDITTVCGSSYGKMHLFPGFKFCPFCGRKI